MSIIATGPGCVYSPVQDRAIGPVGSELRRSIEAAIASPPRPRTRMEELIETVGVALREGRDNEGVLIAVEPYSRMIEFLSVLPVSVPLPAVVVESEHQIGMDWDLGPRRVVAITIDETPSIGYSALFGHEPLHGRVPFAGAVPKTVAYLLQRLYGSPASGSTPA